MNKPKIPFWVIMQLQVLALWGLAALDLYVNGGFD